MRRKNSAATSDKVYQLLARGRWFSSGTKTGGHDIAEILLNGVVNTTNQSIHRYDSGYTDECSITTNNNTKKNIKYNKITKKQKNWFCMWSRKLCYYRSFELILRFKWDSCCHIFNFVYIIVCLYFILVFILSVLFQVVVSGIFIIFWQHLTNISAL